MKRKKIIIVFAVLAGCGVVYMMIGMNGDSDQAAPKVKVVRGTIVDRALAVGTIEPENEISIKSKISGAVSRLYADAGSFVHRGDPLLEVRPEPTPLELAEAKRNVELADVELENMKKERVRQDALSKKQLISDKEYESFESSFSEAELRLNIAKEKLALLESGKVKIGGKAIESVIYAPIDGFVLSKTVEVGDPVTPLTSFQEGTVLMRMANMDRLVFKGTVDEIDVGKLSEGMPVDIRVGALPSDTVRGILSKISLKAEKKENATVFPVEISIPLSKERTLRAGYSANASIIIQRKENVLMVPERVVTFRNDSAFVSIPSGGKTAGERYLQTGLSDAINVEVVSGLDEGDEVEEKALKQIE